MGNFQITEAKIELMQKIINAHLTEEEIKEILDYAENLKNNEVGWGTSEPIRSGRLYKTYNVSNGRRTENPDRECHSSILRSV